MKLAHAASPLLLPLVGLASCCTASLAWARLRPIAAVDELRVTAPAPGTTLELRFALREEHEQVEQQLLVDGEGKPPGPPPAPESRVVELSVEITDTHRRAEAGPPLLERTYAETSARHEVLKGGAGGDTESVSERTSELAGRSWALSREEDEAWTWQPADGGAALELDPAGLRGELDFAAWLPEEPRAEAWTIPASALDELLAPGGDLGWHDADDELREAGDPAPLARYEGGIRARRAAAEDEGLVAVELELDVEVTRDTLPEARLRVERRAALDGGRPADELERTEVRNYRGEGRLLWDARRGGLRELTVELEYEEVWRRRFELDLPDATRSYELTLRSQGSTQASVAVHVE